MNYQKAWLELKAFVDKSVEERKVIADKDIEAGLTLKPFEQMLKEMNHIEMKMVADVITEITKEDMSYVIHSKRNKGNE